MAQPLQHGLWFVHLENDANAGAVILLLGGCVLLAPPPPEAVLEEEGGDDREAVGSEGGEEMVEEYEMTDHETSDYGDDEMSDDEEEDEEEESDVEEFDVSGGAGRDALLLQMVHPRKFVPEGSFLGGPAPRSADAGNTTGLMRVATADAEDQEGGDSCNKQILVFYRYTRFSAAPFDGGVEARGSTKEHQLRFIASGGLGARTLAWAGASLVPLIYPGCSSNQLRELWSRLIANVSIPPHATRVEVFVDVGILRQADRTDSSMVHMRAALKNTMAQSWPGRFTGMELHLPEPVRCGDEEDKAAHDDDRPAKRRRVVAVGENCGVCLELLEGDDLAAWPGCGKPHVFHGACMEGVLGKNETCPICRHSLYSEPKF